MPVAYYLYYMFLQEQVVYVAVSLPGPKSKDVRAQYRAINLAVDAYNARAGRYSVQILPLDNSVRGVWNLDAEANNARKAVETPGVVAYYGPYHSGAAIASMPILNSAQLLQVSGTMTWPGLTKPGYAIGEPMRYFPAGMRHFFRLAPIDSVQGEVTARYLQELGVRKVVIIHDGGVYGRGIATIFKHSAESLGLKTVYEGVVPGDTVLDEEVAATLAGSPDAVFMGSEVRGGIIGTYAALRAMGYDGIILGSDFMNTNIENAVVFNDEKLYTVHPGSLARHLNNQIAAVFLANYVERYKEEPSPYALYAYESMRLILESIKRSDGTRASVLENFRHINGFPTSFGPVAFDEDGDMVGASGSILRMVGGRWNFETTISLSDDNI